MLLFGMPRLGTTWVTGLDQGTSHYLSRQYMQGVYSQMTI